MIEKDGIKKTFDEGALDVPPIPIHAVGLEKTFISDLQAEQRYSYEIATEDRVYELASSGTPLKTMAMLFGVSVDNLRARYQTAFDVGLANFKLQLHKAQLTKALNQNDTMMQIWLGKQYLEQSDKVQQQIEQANYTITFDDAEPDAD